MILPPEEDELTASLSIPRSALGGLGALGRLGSYFTQADIALAILRSRTVHEKIIAEFDLQEIYKKKHLDDTIKKLEKKSDIKISSDGSISVSVEDSNAERAAELANAFIAALDHFNQEFRTFRARRTRQFLETRIAESDSLLRAAGDQLAEYQREEGSLVVPPEAEGALSAAAGLMAQKTTAEVELEILKTYASPRSEEVRQLETRVHQLRQLVGNLPEVQLGGAELLRELAVQNQVFVILTAQLEQARLREAMDTPTVQLLDRARAPDRRSWPRRGWIALFGAFVGTLLGYAHALGRLPRFGRKT